LQARLLAEHPTLIPVLNRRAAAWHEQNGLPEEAVAYALTARDFDHAAALLTGPAITITRRGEITTLLTWYRAFPPEFVRQHPRLCLQFGQAFALNGRWDEAEALLTLVEQSDATVQPEETLMLAYLIATYRQDGARLAALAAEAAIQPHPDRVTQLVLALIVSLSNDWQTAAQIMAEAQSASERAGDDIMALTALFHQCRFHVFLGNLHQAYELSHQALERVHKLGAAALPMATFAHVSLGRILIEWNRLDEAAHHLTQAVDLSERSGFVTGMLSSATMMLAEVQQGQGDTVAAIQTAQTAISYAERYDPPPEVAWLTTYQTRIWLNQGHHLANRSAIQNWLITSRQQADDLSLSLYYPVTIRPVTQARVLLAQHHVDEAVKLLTTLLNQPHDLLTVEVQGLLALARQEQSNHVHALLALEQALALAEAEQRLRVLLDLGTPLIRLLAAFYADHPDHTFATALLGYFSDTAAAPSASIDSLRDREREVLRLIVAGYSNDEIAQSLTLAVSTVKWYINTLFGKLQVKTRSQAIARAHDLNLLDES
ncbi:MAG TPA: LuxR C-terminal-related transcriptional regulator, partial [Phototrophicaceae bacterium]|nr:LuxR C-terminal-related transcriptional regulator [Phototrophicaceae bacterium]